MDEKNAGKRSTASVVYDKVSKKLYHPSFVWTVEVDTVSECNRPILTMYGLETET